MHINAKHSPKTIPPLLGSPEGVYLLVFAGFLKEEYASRCPSSVITSATMTASGHGPLKILHAKRTAYSVCQILVSFKISQSNTDRLTSVM